MHRIAVYQLLTAGAQLGGFRLLPFSANKQVPFLWYPLHITKGAFLKGKKRDSKNLPEAKPLTPLSFSSHDKN